jgi:hypothetical protein
MLGFLQVAKLLHDFRGDDPHAARGSQHIRQIDIGLFENELDGIASHHLDAVYRLQHLAVGIALLGQQTVIGKLHILGHQLTAVDGRFVVPFHPLAQVEDIGGVVWGLPAFGQVGLNHKGARLNLWTNLMPHQPAVDKAQRRMRLEVSRLMRVEVHRVIPTHAQDAAAPGRPCLCPPERQRVIQWPGGQRDASGQASLQYITTAQTRHRSSNWIWCLHG